MAEEQDSGRLTTAAATVLAAVCALIGGVLGALINGYFHSTAQVQVEETKVTGTLELERLEFQTELIIKALDTDDQDKAVKTLTFFANAGLIPTFETKVLELTKANQGRAIPTLREPDVRYSPTVDNELNFRFQQVGGEPYLISDVTIESVFLDQNKNQFKGEEVTIPMQDYLVGSSIFPVYEIKHLDKLICEMQQDGCRDMRLVSILIKFEVRGSLYNVALTRLPEIEL